MSQLSNNTSPENINKRLFDLVRYMRSDLHKTGLITDDEFAFLIYECPLAQGQGSPSRIRLEDYDEIAAETRIAELEESLKDAVFILREAGWQIAKILTKAKGDSSCCE